MSFLLCLCDLLQVRNKVIERLQRTQWSAVRDVWRDDPFYFRLFPSRRADTQVQAEELANALSMLQAVQLHSDVRDRQVKVMLSEFTITREVIDLLERLPRWRGTLAFDECTWPLDASEYKLLAMHVPTSYCAWDLVGVSEGVGEAILDSVDQRRELLGLPRLG